MVMIVEATEFDEQNALAEELFEREDYRGAAHETKKVLDELKPHLPTIAQAAVVRGQALMADIMNTMSKSGEPPSKESLEEVFQAYELSQMLNPDCEESDFQLTKVARLFRKLPLSDTPTQIADVLRNSNGNNKGRCDYDVLIVGAGAAGVGTALMLTDTFGLDKSRVVLMERGAKVGESFRRWPAEMKFISPSFNQQGWTKSFDLNSIANGSSPAFSLHTEHPSGNDYATYLQALAKMNKLNVQTETEVLEVRDIGISAEVDEDDIDENVSQHSYELEKEEREEKYIPLFSVDIQSLSTKKKETVTARYIVWAAGEFQYPRVARVKNPADDGKETTDAAVSAPEESPGRKRNSATNNEEKKSEKDDYEEEETSKKEFPGAELCMHNSTVRSWATLPGEEYLIIGGYESGVDAAINLSKAGKQCKVLASTPCWSVKTADPSAELAPYTAARLRDVLSQGFSPQPQLMAPVRVVKVEKAVEEGTGRSGFNVTAQWQAQEESDEQPNLRNLLNLNDATEPHGQEGSTFVIHTPNPPVLCTGFEGSVAAAASHLFDFADEKGEFKVDDEDDDEDVEEPVVEEIDGAEDVQMNENKNKESDNEDMEGNEKSDHEHEHEHGKPAKKGGCLAGAPLLTKDDESTIVPGVFLVGPTVSHGSHSFCFVYKFRQRFAIVANAICQGLGRDTRAAVNECRDANMYLDDLGCCEDTCGDVC